MILHSGEIPPNLLSIFHYTLSATKLQSKLSSAGKFSKLSKLSSAACCQAVRRHSGQNQCNSCKSRRGRHCIAKQENPSKQDKNHFSGLRPCPDGTHRPEWHTAQRHAEDSLHGSQMLRASVHRHAVSKRIRKGCDHDRNQYRRKILRAVFPEMRTLHQKDPAQNQAGHGKVCQADIRNPLRYLLITE